MNIKKIADTYQTLGELSDYGPDIFGSEYSRGCLEKAGVLEQDAASALLRMQMEQERLSRIPMWYPFSYSAEEVFPMVRRNVVSELQKRLAHYTQEQQGGICLFMWENINSMRGYTCTEQQRLQWARLPTERLMELTAEEVLQCVGRLFEENSQQFSQFEEDAQIEEGMLSPITSRSAAAAATAVAVYAECPEYHGNPEWVAESAYMVQDVWTVNAELFALMLIMMSAMMLLSILLSCIGVGVGISVLATTGVELSWGKITAEFVSFISLYKTELLIAAGMGITGLVINGAVKLIRMLLGDSQTPEVTQQDMSIEEANKDMDLVQQALGKENDGDSDDIPTREHQRA